MTVALRSLTARHDILRSACRFEDGRIRQTVDPDGAPDFEARRVSSERLDKDLIRFLATPSDPTSKWAEQAVVLSAGAPGVHIAELSFAIAMAHVRRFAGMREPIRVKRLGLVV